MSLHSITCHSCKVKQPTLDIISDKCVTPNCEGGLNLGQPYQYASPIELSRTLCISCKVSTVYGCGSSTTASYTSKVLCGMRLANNNEAHIIALVEGKDAAGEKWALGSLAKEDITNVISEDGELEYALSRDYNNKNFKGLIFSYIFCFLNCHEYYSAYNDVNGATGPCIAGESERKKCLIRVEKEETPYDIHRNNVLKSILDPKGGKPSVLESGIWKPTKTLSLLSKAWGEQAKLIKEIKNKPKKTSITDKLLALFPTPKSLPVSTSTNAHTNFERRSLFICKHMEPK